MSAPVDSTPGPEAKASAEQAAHSCYDGIEEHDNHLPRWWLATLFGAIVFSFGYWFYYQHLLGPGQRAELAADERLLADLRDKAIASKVSDESLAAMTKDPAAIARGAELFKANCVACHEAQGQGKIGPNLTDAFWIHGGKPMQVLKTVLNGVPEKGMLSWGPVLGAGKSQEVVAYTLTLRNTNVAGKAPEGTKEE